jgi:hypothetical protein|tara:strand:+ start:369 stop:965 length:597 start_codon:yes stop_codon:yes gene_type:complete
MSQGNIRARRLRNELGNSDYGLQREAAMNRGNQRFANFLGSLTNIPIGGVGFKGIFPSTAVARDADTAYPNPFIMGKGGEYVPNTQALDEAGEYNKQYDAFLNNFLTEDHSLAPNATSFSADQSSGIVPKISDKTIDTYEQFIDRTQNSPAMRAGVFDPKDLYQTYVQNQDFQAARGAGNLEQFVKEYPGSQTARRMR